ncbi:7-cyano-7-deazaguanine synthase [Roseateles puraquae]|uniref:7-cyano-7-deazaguanine synthase n=1 Tax=Roseateles puraquae TaxID=431059 RepID=A0A254MXM6_9BURK|nr:7-cyano-7-deazaguanine synthase [Roseateles puraquae]MDG0857424.1 hypothetical protein [Roseateles puraquae]OWQ98095.1 hypothetical protein CDO81_26865 [Roseateles puraquae]
MDERFCRPSLNKQETWHLSHTLGGPGLLELVRRETHTCYLGDHTTWHEWGYGCGTCPACELRSKGYDAYMRGQP